ncbi:MAG: dihydroorotate dehydrogenase electron transfer subunit [Eubacteriales bacterium]|nr:dihydroorotate dehydrogenase electron transfer subunit [Eubacteriales bacterium]
MQQIEWDCTILENQPLNDQFFILTLQGEAISQTAQPGQFVNVSCQQFLRRPFGIMAVDRAAGTFRIGIQVKGKGTREFKDLKPGTVVSVLGPLGHGFDMAGYRQVITVGGGTGVFPLFFVHDQCRAEGVRSVAVCGYRSPQDAILVEEFRQLATQALFASDNGGLDVDGHAALALDHVLAGLESLENTVVLTCGPKIMMQAVAERAARAGLPCQVSLEERMGCGIGICLVCVCKIKEQETGQISHQRCCVDGPVFPAEAVVW